MDYKMINQALQNSGANKTRYDDELLKLMQGMQAQPSQQFMYEEAAPIDDAPITSKQLPSPTKGRGSPKQEELSAKDQQQLDEIINSGLEDKLDPKTIASYAGIAFGSGGSLYVLNKLQDYNYMKNNMDANQGYKARPDIPISNAIEGEILYPEDPKQLGGSQAKLNNRTNNYLTDQSTVIDNRTTDLTDQRSRYNILTDQRSNNKNLPKQPDNKQLTYNPYQHTNVPEPSRDYSNAKEARQYDQTKLAKTLSIDKRVDKARTLLESADYDGNNESINKMIQQMENAARTENPKEMDKLLRAMKRLLTSK